MVGVRLLLALVIRRVAVPLLNPRVLSTPVVWLRGALSCASQPHFAFGFDKQNFVDILSIEV